MAETPRIVHCEGGVVYLQAERDTFKPNKPTVVETFGHLPSDILYAWLDSDGHMINRLREQGTGRTYLQHASRCTVRLDLNPEVRQ